MAGTDAGFTGMPRGGARHGGRGHGRSLRMATLVLAILLTPVATLAGSREARLLVGATVLANATLSREQRAEFLEITADDVARGYVEVPRAAHLMVASTSPLGFALDVWPVSGLFSRLDIGGVGADVTLPAEGGAITLRGRHGLAEPLELAIRFSLAPGVTSGRYPWPLRFAVRPL